MIYFLFLVIFVKGQEFNVGQFETINYQGLGNRFGMSSTRNVLDPSTFFMFGGVSYNENSLGNNSDLIFHNDVFVVKEDGTSVQLVERDTSDGPDGLIFSSAVSLYSSIFSQLNPPISSPYLVIFGGINQLGLVNNFFYFGQVTTTTGSTKLYIEWKKLNFNITGRFGHSMSTDGRHLALYGGCCESFDQVFNDIWIVDIEELDLKVLNISSKGRVFHSSWVPKLLSGENVQLIVGGLYSITVNITNPINIINLFSQLTLDIQKPFTSDLKNTLIFSINSQFINETKLNDIEDIVIGSSIINVKNSDSSDNTFTLYLLGGLNQNGDFYQKSLYLENFVGSFSSLSLIYHPWLDVEWKNLDDGPQNSLFFSSSYSNFQEFGLIIGGNDKNSSLMGNRIWSKSLISTLTDDQLDPLFFNQNNVTFSGPEFTIFLNDRDGSRNGLTLTYFDFSLFSFPNNFYTFSYIQKEDYNEEDDNENDKRIININRSNSILIINEFITYHGYEVSKCGGEYYAHPGVHVQVLVNNSMITNDVVLWKLRVASGETILQNVGNEIVMEGNFYNVTMYTRQAEIRVVLPKYLILENDASIEFTPSLSIFDGNDLYIGLAIPTSSSSSFSFYYDFHTSILPRPKRSTSGGDTSPDSAELLALSIGVPICAAFALILCISMALWRCIGVLLEERNRQSRIQKIVSKFINLFDVDLNPNNIEE